MRLSSVSKLSLLLFVIPGFVFGPGSEQLSEVSQKHSVKYAGLTKTLVNLLKTRTPRNFVIGAYEISMEDLIGTDIATVFDCDSVTNNYMSEAGEGASYEMLSDVLKNKIWERFKSDGTLFVNVSSDTASDGFFINFSIFKDKPVSIPIVLNASDTSFSTSFDTTCTLKFESDIDLFINAGKVNSGFKKDGVRIRINKLSFELTSGSENEEQTDESDCQDNESSDSSGYVPKPQKTVPFYLGGKKYSAAARCFSINAISYWYLTPADATDFVIDEGQCYTLSYKQLEKGDFKWDNENLGSFSTRLIMIPEEEKWDSLAFAEKSNRFSYTVDNLFDDEGLEQISLCCDYGLNEGITARNKKYVLK
jgi:hypothetical protein